MNKGARVDVLVYWLSGPDDGGMAPRQRKMANWEATPEPREQLFQLLIFLGPVIMMKLPQHSIRCEGKNLIPALRAAIPTELPRPG